MPAVPLKPPPPATSGLKIIWPSCLSDSQSRAAKNTVPVIVLAAGSFGSRLFLPMYGDGKTLCTCETTVACTCALYQAPPPSGPGAPEELSRSPSAGGNLVKPV